MLRWHRELVNYQPGCRKRTQHQMCEYCECCLMSFFNAILCANRYFQHLVASFEAKMELYRRQIEELDCHLNAISAESAMSPQSECLVFC